MWAGITGYDEQGLDSVHITAATVHPFIHAGIHPSIYPSIHLSIHPAIHSCIHPSRHPAIHLSIDVYAAPQAGL
jgi:hypothetical protein